MEATGAPDARERGCRDQLASRQAVAVRGSPREARTGLGCVGADVADVPGGRRRRATPSASLGGVKRACAVVCARSGQLPESVRRPSHIDRTGGWYPVAGVVARRSGGASSQAALVALGGGPG